MSPVKLKIEEKHIKTTEQRYTVCSAQPTLIFNNYKSSKSEHKISNCIIRNYNDVE